MRGSPRASPHFLVKLCVNDLEFLLFISVIYFEIVLGAKMNIDPVYYRV